MHADDLPVTEDTVARLLADQFPEWAGLPVRAVRPEGTDNRMFRVGEDLVARFPREPGAPAEVLDALHRDVRAARTLADATRFPVPLVRGIGQPGDGYPQPWSVQTWLPGVTAAQDDPAESVDFARDLAEFIRDIRRVDTSGWDRNGGRGGDLTEHDDWMATCFRHSEGLLDVDALRRMWAEFLALPAAGPDVLSHRDLIPGNVLVHSGRLAGVLDVSQLARADPALELVCAWHLLAAEPRAALRAELGCGDVEWERGRAWAFQQAMGLVWYYVERNPPMSALGRRTLDRLGGATD